MPIILVDWSDVREQTLRASISVQGRSMTLYERSFLFEDYNAHRSHNAFLAGLANVLSQGLGEAPRRLWPQTIETHFEA